MEKRLNSKSERLTYFFVNTKIDIKIILKLRRGDSKKWCLLDCISISLAKIF